MVKERLIKRGTESEKSLKTRVENAETEIKKLKGLYYYTEIVNDDLEKCYKEVVEYLQKRYNYIL